MQRGDSPASFHLFGNALRGRFEKAQYYIVRFDVSAPAILELLRALLSNEESDLIQYMEKQNGNYLVLDRIYLLTIFKRLNLPWPNWIEIQASERYTRVFLKPAGRRINYLKCLFDQGSLRRLRVVFRSGNYVVLRRDPSA